MAVFAVEYRYADQPAAVTEHRPAHRAFLQNLLTKGFVLAAGAYIDQPAGALLVLRGDSAEDVATILDDDPFAHLGLITNRQIRPWSAAIGPWSG